MFHKLLLMVIAVTIALVASSNAQQQEQPTPCEIVRNNLAGQLSQQATTLTDIAQKTSDVKWLEEQLARVKKAREEAVKGAKSN